MIIARQPVDATSVRPGVGKAGNEHTRKRRQLQRMFAHLSPQRRPLTVAGAPHRVPSRHRRWQQLYDISRRVVAGFGMDFELEEAPAPGFVFADVALMGGSAFPGDAHRPTWRRG